MALYGLVDLLPRSSGSYSTTYYRFLRSMLRPTTSSLRDKQGYSLSKQEALDANIKFRVVEEEAARRWLDYAARLKTVGRRPLPFSVYVKEYDSEVRC